VQGDQIGPNRAFALAQPDGAVVGTRGPHETCLVEGRPPAGCLSEPASGLHRAHSNGRPRLVTVGGIPTLDASLGGRANPVRDRVWLPVRVPAERGIGGAVTGNSQINRRIQGLRGTW
jgi:hypothetical protein